MTYRGPDGLEWRFLCDLDFEFSMAGGNGWMEGTPHRIGARTAKVVVDAGWAQAKADGPRYLYRITPVGRQIVAAEIARGRKCRLSAHLQ